MSISEKQFQLKLIKEIKEKFKGSIVTKLDSGHIQGLPDILILYKDKWATLECKKSKNSKCQPNQNYYNDILNEMSYSNFVYPENKEDILNELQQVFKL